MKLPEAFLESMKALLGEEYEAWLHSYEEPSHQGLRLNTTKLDARRWEEGLCPFSCSRVSWIEHGYEYQNSQRPARHPYYYAGLYYLQEPSAMTPAAILAPEPGERVLDLCAAPGGKSTELGARLQGKGILVSNDISSSRARALLKNLELFGLKNICVTAETPEKLADTFGAFFDKILVDAPCSGEGMFRKDPELIKSWAERGPEYYAPIQKEILSRAVRMLRPGGRLLYSTCTFSPVEDEEVVRWLLETEPELELEPIPLWEGAAKGCDGMPVVRLFPHKIKGEGHFLALFRKRRKGEEAAKAQVETVQAGATQIGTAPAALAPAEVAQAVVSGMQSSGNIRQKPDPQLSVLLKESDFSQWEQQLAAPLDHSRIMIREGEVYLLPEEFDRSWRLRYLRTGLLLGTWKKQRFEPSQAMAMTLSKNAYGQVLDLPVSDERVIRYLKGETLALSDEERQSMKKGWILVCVDSFPLGWAKAAGAALKNKYYPGWRWQ